MLFSSLSESGFIPTQLLRFLETTRHFGVLISFREWLHSYLGFRLKPESSVIEVFSSLSESGFIPTSRQLSMPGALLSVLISFREWLHSYNA